MLALGIDPDLHHAGLALVESPTGGNRPKVVWTGVALAPRKLKSYAAAAALEWPRLPWNDTDGFGRLLIGHEHTFGEVDILVVEGQRIYPHSPVDPEDLMHLAFAAGCALQQYQDGALAKDVPHPQQWKGSIPKPVAHARILSRCIIIPEAAELLAGPHKSHVTDAIGLALWGLGLPGAIQQGRIA